MRLFLAIELPERLKGKVSQIKINDFIGKRVETNNLHVNLKFFGEVPSPERIISIVSKVKFKPFKIVLNGLGAFPKKEFPRVLHVKVESPELIELHKRIEREMKNFDKRPYAPHVTLMRVKEQERPTTFFEEEFLEEFMVDKIILFRSDLQPDGPDYEKVYEFKAVNT